MSGWRTLALASLVLFLPTQAAAQNASNGRVEYVRPGDVIKLEVWREEDMTKEILVPQSGIVVFPAIGPMRVTHLPKPELRDSIIAALQVFRRNPAIEVTFLKRISILGSVKEPDLYNVDETMTVAAALALAGGATPDGKQNEFRLMRGDEVLRAKVTQRDRISDLPLESGDQLFVPQRDWFARNSSLVAALISGAVSVAVTLLVQK